MLLRLVVARAPEVVAQRLEGHGCGRTGTLLPGHRTHRIAGTRLHGAPGRPFKHRLHHELWRPRLEHTELPSETPWMGEVAAPPGALLSSRHAPGMKRGEEDSHTPSTRHSRLPVASEFRMITTQSLQPMSECWASPLTSGHRSLWQPSPAAHGWNCLRLKGSNQSGNFSRFLLHYKQGREPAIHRDTLEKVPANNGLVSQGSASPSSDP